MKGLVYDGEKAVLRDDLEVRSPGPTEVKVRVVACGLCHSDLSVIDGTIPWPTPVVLGHEGAGIVEEVGAAVRNVAPGDHVVLHILTNCGTCKWCSIGKPVCCRATMANADQPFVRDGAPVWNFSGASFLAEHTLVGGVGLHVIQGARIKGASRIVAIDTNPAKEAIARRRRHRPAEGVGRRVRRAPDDRLPYGLVPARLRHPVVPRPVPARRRHRRRAVSRPARFGAKRHNLP